MKKGKTCAEIQQMIAAHEILHGCRALRVQFSEGAITQIDCVPWPSKPYWVDVYNCHLSLVEEVSHEGGTTSLQRVEIPSEREEEVYLLLVTDIEAQGGAINMSGQYALSTVTVAKLRDLGVIP